MCCGGYPDPSGWIIAALEKGDMVSLEGGAGTPPAPTARILTIYEVNDFSALCTDGTRLSCVDGSRLVKLEQKDPHPVPSLAARKILFGLWLGEVRESLHGMVDDVDFEIWLLKRKIQKRFTRKSK